MPNAKQITEDISWNMDDSGLTLRATVKVRTTRKGDQFQTTISGVDADRAKAALEDYFRGYPQATTQVREADNALVVIQPAN